jgi:RNA polymerase sigma-70 factor, ECF subfamily
VDGRIAAAVKTPPAQHSHWEFQEFRQALTRLSADQRESLLLVGASNFSYEEAAEICGCAIGTIKSRVNRARARLAEILSIDPHPDVRSDPRLQAE